LEFDHAEAWAWKRAHSIESITLRCRAHNQQRARLDFGEPHMARFDRHSLSSAAGPGSDPNRAGARGAGDQLSTGFESSHPQLTRVSS
jgi:hypothetical protein